MNGKYLAAPVKTDNRNRVRRRPRLRRQGANLLGSKNSPLTKAIRQAQLNGTSQRVFFARSTRAFQSGYHRKSAKGNDEGQKIEGGRVVLNEDAGGDVEAHNSLLPRHHDIIISDDLIQDKNDHTPDINWQTWDNTESRFPGIRQEPNRIGKGGFAEVYKVSTPSLLK